MSEHFIKNIEIDNFKCFNSFKAEGFKRVNLIGGKNNVGKTAFMEACYINVEENSSIALLTIIESRYKLDFFEELLKEVGLQFIRNSVKNKAQELKNSTITTNLQAVKVEYDETKILNISNKKTLFIDTKQSSSQDLDEFYANILENRLEEELDTALKLFDENLDSFRIIKSIPKCSLVSDKLFYNLNEFGDGTYRYITYLAIFLSFKDGIVFIDEIDNGIHFSKFDEMWKMILILSKKNNIQLFTTTHSKECIDSYARVSKKLKDENTTFIALGRDKESKLKAIVMKSERFYRELRDGNGVRGW